MMGASFSDIALETSDGKEIRAHRCVLAAWSPVFSRMFEEMWTYQRLELLIAADKYGVQELKQRLDKDLCGELNDDTAFECLKVADMHGASLLREASSKYIVNMNPETSMIPLKRMLLGDNNMDRELAVDLIEKLWSKRV
ncbi:unnamed protein product [Closterium sp. Yama58-4]|nr:unnamed protein product [Closterium sp. Yama58-4]